MITQIKDVPFNMLAFQASGEVTKDDFDVVIDEVKKLVDATRKLNYLLKLDNSPADFTIGAWLQDTLLGIKNLSNWNRAAIVSDSENVLKFTAIFSKLMPGEFRGFHHEDYQQALDWTSEKTI